MLAANPNRRFSLDPWRTAVFMVALVVSLPVFSVFSFVFRPAGEVWAHLVDTVLAAYVSNSLLLMLGVAVGTLLIGVGTAWLTSQCRFPGRKVLAWALLLPMAFPAYIIAYTYTGMLDFSGPVQSGLRAWFGWGYGDYWFPQVRSLGGAVVMLSLVLYPYVYLLARAAFLRQSNYAFDVSRSLGCGPWCCFFRVSLPSARPAILAGLSLALMETLADYGTVQYFGVSTFTTGIFRTWFGLGDSAAAAQLSSVLMVFVFALILVERWSRHQAAYHETGTNNAVFRGYQLRGMRAWLASGVCVAPLTLGFLVPGGQLVVWAAETAPATVDAGFWKLVLHSVALAVTAGLLALLLALLLAYGRRLRGNLPVSAAVHVAGLGYAVPGTVIAVGVMLPLAWFDQTLDSWARASLGVSTGLLLSGTLVALLFAYMVRFLAVSLQTVESGLAQIRSSMDDAARSLGCRPASILRRVHLPMLKGAMLTAVLLVFVDVMKELPATLILRPFNFNTLAVRAYELASDERLRDSASAAVAIVLAGIVPVILLSRSISHSGR